jgi:hypothetical protein
MFRTVRFSPDGRLVVAINAQGKAQLWRAPSIQELDSLEAMNR